MSWVPLTEVIEGLRAGRIVLRPPWFQPGPPRVCWMLRDGEETLLVVWDTALARVAGVHVYDDARLSTELPRLVGRPQVPAWSVVPRTAEHDAVVAPARAAASRLARTLASLEERPDTSLVETAPNGATHLSFAPGIGWRTFFVSDGKIVHQSRVGELALEATVSEMFARSESLAPSVMEPALLASLATGERRFLTLRARMARGEIGWRVHVDRVVVDVDGAFYNAAFHGTLVTYSHAFLQGHVLADMLTRTLLEDEPSAVVPLLPGQQESLRASVAPR